MKLILIVLFCTFFSVRTKITFMNNVRLTKEGDPITLVCDKPLAKWELREKIVAHCGNCPSSKCDVDEYYKERITAFCSQENSILHFNSTRMEDDGHSIRCPESDSKYSKFRVGRYDRLRPENNSPFALYQKNFTLVCKKGLHETLEWVDEQGEQLSIFLTSCSNTYSNDDGKRFEFTCEKEQGKLHIKNVTLIDDGKIFGCESDWTSYLSVFRLTVNVPVTSVSIQPQSGFVVENERIFICKVEESKPEASFQWVILYQNGSTQNIQQTSTTISKTLRGKLWQTNSTIKLKLKKDYQKIMCKATILNLPWTNSEYQSFDIKYSKFPTLSTVPATKPPTSTKVPATKPPTSTKVPATKPPTSTKVPATKPPTSTKVPATKPPTSTKVPATKPPTSTKVPATKPPTSTKVPATKPPTNTKVPATKMSTVSEVQYSSPPTDPKVNVMVPWGIAVFSIIIIISGIIYSICRRQSRNKRNNNSQKNSPSSGGHEMTTESIYDSLYDIPSSEHYDSLYEVVESSEPTPENKPYDDAIDVSIKQKQKNKIHPEYLEIPNHPPVREKKLEILNRPPVKEPTPENKPYDDAIDVSIKQKKKNRIQPEYLEILNRPPAKDFLDYEDLRN